MHPKRHAFCLDLRFSGAIESIGSVLTGPTYFYANRLSSCLGQQMGEGGGR